MSWPPSSECNWCGLNEVVWAYPVGKLTFWRRLPDGQMKEIDHHAQPWYACGRCKKYVDRQEWRELAGALGKAAGYFDRLRAAMLHSSGYEWSVVRRHQRPFP
jgi:hypothetical protein